MNEEQIKELIRSSKAMQVELIQLKSVNAGQSQFLDSLEHLLLDYGFKLVGANE